MANRVEPTFAMFNVFYTVTYTSGFYSFNPRTGVAPVCSVPLKSLHDWKQKFFYIRRGVIPMDMHYRSVDEGIPKIDVLSGFSEQSWYKKITHKATAISQLEEMALVGAGMSLLWVPKNPLGVPVYGYNGKLGYSLLNVLDPKAAGAMVEAIQEDGKPTWLEQIRPRFLHPTNDSFVTYSNVVFGEPDGDNPVGLTREDVVVLSSGSSGRSFGDLTSHFARAGPAQGVVNEPAQETVGDDDDVPVVPSAQLETRRETKTDKLEKGEKRVEGKTVGTSLGNEVISWRRYSLPLLLQVKYFDCVKSSRPPRRVDVSKITPPTSPPSRTIDLSPPHDDRGKKKEGEVATERVGEGGGDAAGGDGGDTAGGDGRGKGADTTVESSQTAPHQTIYTKHPPGDGGGATSGVVRSPQFENVHADSWDTHNPACDDLPHAPRWNLTHGSRMNDVGNCHDFFSLSLPPC
ncbi:hypothetical protein HanHA300_Chr14g0520701 [Helianthus annuus]|nr:hypothetical protein HanHA300_Chr14g0520701 [Helianthus annuus]